VIAKVLSASFKDFGGVFSETQHRVTTLANERTNVAGRVIVVNVPFIISASGWSWFFTTYGTLKVLPCFHSARIFGRKPLQAVPVRFWPLLFFSVQRGAHFTNVQDLTNIVRRFGTLTP
jgi:hypothetical protein